MKKFFLLFASTLLLIFLTVLSGCQSEEIVVPENILNHIKAYPELEAVDIYKFIYQSNMGAAHAKIEYENAYNWLKKEISSVDATNPQDYPLMEVISENYVRLHLAPFIALNGDAEALTNSFINSMEGPSDTVKLKSDWETVVKAAKKGIIAYPPYKEFKALDQKIKSNNWPVVHHSEKYKTIYKPNYRILEKEIASLLIADILTHATKNIELED